MALRAGERGPKTRRTPAATSSGICAPTLTRLPTPQRQPAHSIPLEERRKHHDHIRRSHPRYPAGDDHPQHRAHQRPTARNRHHRPPRPHSRNAEFAEQRFAAGLQMMPSLKAIIIGCVDPRVDPAQILGNRIRGSYGHPQHRRPRHGYDPARTGIVAQAHPGQGKRPRSGMRPRRPAAHRLWNRSATKAAGDVGQLPQHRRGKLGRAKGRRSHGSPSRDQGFALIVNS